MAKKLDWVREEPSGRLIYRRAYPEALRPYLVKAGQRELKVPLGARFSMTDASWRAYGAAKRRFERDVARAQAAQELDRKQNGGLVDWLSPEMIEHMVSDWKEEILTVDDEVRWMPRSRERKIAARANLRVEVEAELAADIEAKALGDADVTVRRWGEVAADHARLLGVRVDREAPEFLSYLRALQDAAIDANQIMLRRLDGDSAPTPKATEQPSVEAPGLRRRNVSALIAAYRAAKWDGWSQSSRSAVSPAFRVLEDTIAQRDVRSIGREDARSLLALVQQLPAGLGRKKELSGLAVPEAVEKGRQLGLPVISPGTVNLAYLSHISALFAWAEAEEWADRNPFKGLQVHDPVADADKRDPFTPDQLVRLFSAAPWGAPLPYEDPKPGRYWVPLIALYSGMRLGEIAGLRLMDLEEREEIPAFNIRPYEGRTLKNLESRREVPLHPELIALGLLAFAEARRKVGKPGELLFPDAKPNIRGQWGAKLSEWFVKHLRERNVVGTKLGFHSFRHNFEDRLRAAKLHGTPIGLRLTGRKVGGSAGSYGDGFTMADRLEALEKVSYPGLDLGELRASP